MVCFQCLYSFSVAAIANDHPCSGLKQHSYYLTVLVATSPKSVSQGVIRERAGSSGGAGKAPSFVLFSSERLLSQCLLLPALRPPPMRTLGIVQDDLSGSGFLTLITSAKPLCHGQSHSHSSRGEGGAFVGGPPCSNKSPVYCVGALRGIDFVPPGASYSPWPLPGPCGPELPLV